MTYKTPHIHAKILTAGARDIERKILGKHVLTDFWQEVTLAVVAGSDQSWEFCFSSNAKSSLTDDELYQIAERYNSCDEDINCQINRAIADAATQRTFDELKVPDKEWFATRYEDDDLLEAVISKYIEDLKEGKL